MTTDPTTMTRERGARIRITAMGDDPAADGRPGDTGVITDGRLSRGYPVIDVVLDDGREVLLHARLGDRWDAIEVTLIVTLTVSLDPADVATLPGFPGDAHNPPESGLTVMLDEAPVVSALQAALDDVLPIPAHITSLTYRKDL